MHVTTHQASPQYENIVEVDKECGGDDNEHDYENLKKINDWLDQHATYYITYEVDHTSYFFTSQFITHFCYKCKLAYFTKYVIQSD